MNRRELIAGLFGIVTASKVEAIEKLLPMPSIAKPKTMTGAKAIVYLTNPDGTRTKIGELSHINYHVVDCPEPGFTAQPYVIGPWEAL